MLHRQDIQTNGYTLTWEKFKEFIIKNHNQRQFLYRGQANHKWKLTPSLYRLYPQNDLNKYVRNIIPEVYNQLISKWGFVEYFNLNDVVGFNSFLAKLQHYGFPTPLLDWTYNPYIAVFFALSDEKNLNDFFSIYIFDYAMWIANYYQPINLFDERLLKEYKFVSTFFPGNFNNERAKVQESVFTITNVVDIECFLNSFEKNENKKYLYKINIKVTEKEVIKKDLKYFGITKQRIFPNLEEICNNLAKQFLSPGNASLSVQIQEMMK